MYIYIYIYILMTSKVPFRINELQIENMCYTNIKSNKKKTIQYIKYNDNNKIKNFIFQTPTLLNVNTIVTKNTNIYELDIPLSGKSDNKINNFEQLLNNIDCKIIKDARVNHKWFISFPNQKTMKYQKIIRETNIESNNISQNKKNILRLKILKTNDFETILQLNNNKIKASEIPKNCWIKAILEVYAIWINENGFGLFIRPILIDMKTIQQNIYNYKIIEDDSDEIDDMDDMLCTVQENTTPFSNLFIKSENDITTSVLELDNNNSSATVADDKFVVCSNTSD